eukprot:CAMPEP_0206042588 /NCGR_PEP_ID=MMETSP1466-20131121/6648_1 /ASSEMBLY_ACC=CAM_ASM_001126 /TAXON_ID=44452 /ORGANISM="Pavlova gyrans, Strain CCMP608" /LENGTH=112 /DNA_ID=CAMNT_0053417301 /DNA_START=242 /DNA_END=577 /DNA_ORIENTATION=+
MSHVGQLLILVERLNLVVDHGRQRVVLSIAHKAHARGANLKGRARRRGTTSGMRHGESSELGDELHGFLGKIALDPRRLLQRTPASVGECTMTAPTSQQTKGLNECLMISEW